MAFCHELEVSEERVVNRESSGSGCGLNRYILTLIRAKRDAYDFDFRKLLASQARIKPDG